MNEELKIPAEWDDWSREERQVWCGRKLLDLMREQFVALGLGEAGADFRRWVDEGQLPAGARAAIAAARAFEEER